VKAKAGIPSPKEFARLLRRMDLPARARLSQDVRARKVGEAADEAALLAAMAGRELRGTRWAMVLAGVLAGLNLLSAFLSEDAIRWTSLAVVVVALLSILVFFRRTRPLIRTKRLNQERVRGAE
jgi:hypothetical protein